MKYTKSTSNYQFMNWNMNICMMSIVVLLSPSWFISTENIYWKCPTQKMNRKLLSAGQENTKVHHSHMLLERLLILVKESSCRSQWIFLVCRYIGQCCNFMEWRNDDLLLVVHSRRLQIALVYMLCVALQNWYFSYGTLRKGLVSCQPSCILSSETFW